MTVNYIESWMKSEKPRVIMQAMRANGWLRQHAPEIDRLYGIPQRAEHHPEVDTGIHTELTLEMAGLLSTDPRVRYAALVHDLGKGLTPSELWPRHHGHEELGVAPVSELGRRLGVPEEWQVLARAVTRYHLRAHRALDSSSRSLVRLFRDAQLFERPELIGPFTLACEADARGRSGLQERLYPQGALLRKAFAVACRARVDNPVKLHEARINAVREALELPE